ncbi:hypothetical protein VPHD281_0056 [Vibrio phage D281]
MSPFDKQQGGTHYKDVAIQPIQLGYAVFGGDTCAVKVAKYLTREKDDWSGQIDKAEHILEMFAEAHIHSPIDQLTYAQELILKQFVEQSPEPVREPLMEILTYMVGLAIGIHNFAPEAVKSSFDAIRMHYVGKPENQDDSELPKEIQDALNDFFGPGVKVKPVVRTKGPGICDKCK